MVTFTSHSILATKDIRDPQHVNHVMFINRFFSRNPGLLQIGNSLTIDVNSRPKSSTTTIGNLTLVTGLVDSNRTDMVLLNFFRQHREGKYDFLQRRRLFNLFT